jgi:hypothetical protein
MTSFPPPAGFTGYEECDWGDPEEVYERECTSEEVAILEADAAADLASERREEVQLRDTWFAMVSEELGADQGPAPGAGKKRSGSRAASEARRAAPASGSRAERRAG